MTAFDERRRSPRVRVRHHSLSVATTTRVRVLDISLEGVLMGSDKPLGIATGTLTLPLPSGTVRSLVAVRHRSRDAAGRDHIGATFVAMDRDSHNTLSEFLAKRTR